MCEYVGVVLLLIVKVLTCVQLRQSTESNKFSRTIISMPQSAKPHKKKTKEKTRMKLRSWWWRMSQFRHIRTAAHLSKCNCFLFELSHVSQTKYFLSPVAYLNDMHFQYIPFPTLYTVNIFNWIKSCVSHFLLSLFFFRLSCSRCRIYSFDNSKPMPFNHIIITIIRRTIESMNEGSERKKCIQNNTNARVAAIKNNEKSLQFRKTSSTCHLETIRCSLFLYPMHCRFNDNK